MGRKRHFGRNMLRIQAGKAVVFSGPSFFCGQDFSVSRDKRSLNQWFDTSGAKVESAFCFLPFPNANTTLATLQAYPRGVEFGIRVSY